MKRKNLRFLKVVYIFFKFSLEFYQQAIESKLKVKLQLK